MAMLPRFERFFFLCVFYPLDLKNGETHLVNCDTWVDIHLREVICASKDGARFSRMPECYIRVNTIKYLRVPNEIAECILGILDVPCGVYEWDKYPLRVFFS